MSINALNILPTKTASCSVMGDYAVKMKMTVPYGKAKKGDIVNYDFNHNGTSDHTGIIYKVKNGKIYVVEGNTSDGNDSNGGEVMKRVRVKGNVNLIIRPKYTKEVTANMVVATALAEVGTKEKPKNSNNVKYNTWYYGHEVAGKDYPWCEVFVCWCFANVVTKPTGKYTGPIPQPTLKKGSKGESVKQLQKFLNWYNPAWNLTVDGKQGNHTDRALRCFQKTEEIGVDGVYGKNSYKHANAYKAGSSPDPSPDPQPKIPPNAQKLISKMQDLAWAYGTPSKKWRYKTGAPKAVCKKAMSKYGYNTKEKLSDCGNFVTTVVRESGIDKKFKALHGVNKPFPKKEDKFDLVFSGKSIPDGLLKPADMIRYKKKKGQHAMFYFGDGKVCDAGHYSRFGNIRKDEKRYKRSNVKTSTIQVFRVKE